jgi:hypothetical protein
MSVRGFVRRNGIGRKICKPFTEHFREREWVISGWLRVRFQVRFACRSSR